MLNKAQTAMKMGYIPGYLFSLLIILKLTFSEEKGKKESLRDQRPRAKRAKWKRNKSVDGCRRKLLVLPVQDIMLQTDTSALCRNNYIDESMLPER
ncbi:hypothetical protein V9K67_15200 [Paraflavisolibacter sp. H34]|uniref:hypothetical protein n=1 Tax=Huijunlia imazamoxiresistens TaxID=3127457 RepID=UPI003017395C